MIDKQPLVSVLMSTYNEKIDDIKLSIESILNQTYKNIEFIIIIDNPLNTELINIINKYSEQYNAIKVIKNEENIGLVKSLNKGLKLCTGKYIARMDADDISRIDRIEKQVRYLESNEDVFLLGSDIEFIDEDGNNIDIKSRCIEDSEKIRTALKYKNCMNHPTWVIRKELFDKYITDGYREIPFAEDYDLVCRVNSMDLEAANINEKLLKYRIRGNGISVSNSYKQLIASKYVKEMYRNSINNKSEEYNFLQLNNRLNTKSKVYDTYSYLKSLQNNKKGFSSKFIKVAEKGIGLLNKYTREDFFDELNIKKFYK